MKKYPMPMIYTTAQWGAKPVGEAFDTDKPEKGLVHHMDTQNFALQPDKAKALASAFQLARDCQSTHMNSNGWADTGQQFTVTRNGVILEGRHGSLAAVKAGKNVIGAQCYGFNSKSFGVEHEGTYTDAEMPKVQWDASVELFSWIIDMLGLTSSDIDGHRDHVSTACPGNKLYSELPKFRLAVHEKLATWRAHNVK